MRGHGALLGAMDTTLHVVKSASVRTATVVKANDSEEGEMVAFDLESVKIGEDGTTAPVVIPTEASAAASIRQVKWPKGLKLVHEAVVAAVLDTGANHRVGGDGPAVKAVPVGSAREIHKRRYVSNGEGDRAEAERKAWARNFKHARDASLIEGELSSGQELIWLVSP